MYTDRLANVSKKIFFALFPSSLLRYLHKFTTSGVTRYWSRRVLEKTRGLAVTGVFKGMQIGFRSAWSGQADFISRTFGTYEEHLIPEIDPLSSRYDTWEWFLDIGAADGYFMCAVLTKGWAKSSICYEANPKISESLRQNLAENNVESNVRGVFDLESSKGLLSELGKSSGLVLVDIEGGEFDPAVAELIEGLPRFKFVIELHLPLDSEEVAKLRVVGEKNHKVRLIQREKRTRIDLSTIGIRDLLPEWEEGCLTLEGRPFPQTWMVLDTRK